jgi:hypothetical protein
MTTEAVERQGSTEVLASELQGVAFEVLYSSRSYLLSAAQKLREDFPDDGWITISIPVDDGSYEVIQQVKGKKGLGIDRYIVQDGKRDLADSIDFGRFGRNNFQYCSYELNSREIEVREFLSTMRGKIADPEPAVKRGFLQRWARK